MDTTPADNPLHESTRKIYEQQHVRIASDAPTFDRILGLYSDQSFGLDPHWFEGKDALDAGCGNIGALIVRLVGLGCRSVHAVDIGSDWIEILRAQLTSHQVPASTYELVPGNVLELPFEDDRFDFVAVNGVLINLEDLEEVERAFVEGARVCKRGGYYFTSYGPCGGLIQGVIMPAVRKHYGDDARFKEALDTLTPATIHAVIDKVCADAEQHTGEQFNGPALKALFTEDTCVFLQNFIQAPRWLSNECTPDFVVGLYEKCGFTNITRLNEYVRRNDIRKYLAPLHFDKDHPASQLLYGEGYVKYIAEKA